MRTYSSILTIIILSTLIAQSSLHAQQHANASATVTVTVLPAVGVEVQERISSPGENGTMKQEFDIKVNDAGKYSLRIIDGSNRSSLLSKELGTNNTYHLQERASGSKQIVQLALLSS